MDPDKYKSIGNGFKLTVKEDGARGLAKGWAPTFIGYSMQGLCKFGFYEVFKIFYSDLLGEVRTQSSRVGQDNNVDIMFCNVSEGGAPSAGESYVVKVSIVILRV